MAKKWKCPTEEYKGWLKKSGKYCVQVDGKPITELDTSPDISDIVDFDDEFERLKEDFPEDIEIYKLEHDIENINKIDKEKFVREWYYDHEISYSDQVDFYWESNMEFVGNILKWAGFEEGDRVCAGADVVNWTGRGGSRCFTYKNTRDFVEKTLGAFGDDYSGRIYKFGDKVIEAGVSTHDIPTGNHMQIVDVQEDLDKIQKKYTEIRERHDNMPRHYKNFEKLEKQMDKLAQEYAQAGGDDEDLY